MRELIFAFIAEVDINTMKTQDLYAAMEHRFGPISAELKKQAPPMIIEAIEAKDPRYKKIG